MNSSIRLANSIIRDGHHEAATDRQARAAHGSGLDAGAAGDATPTRRILQRLGRPLGLRPAR